MRINVYDEEIDGEVKMITKTASDTGLTFTGLRIYLASPDVLHNEPNDDDRSAITFWFEQGADDQEHVVRDVLYTAAHIGLAATTIWTKS
jgi:hypothetical protein